MAQFFFFKKGGGEFDKKLKILCQIPEVGEKNVIQIYVSNKTPTQGQKSSTTNKSQR